MGSENNKTVPISTGILVSEASILVRTAAPAMFRLFLGDPEAIEYGDLHKVQKECKDNCPRKSPSHHEQWQRRHGNPETRQGCGDRNISYRRKYKPEAWTRRPQALASPVRIGRRLIAENHEHEGEGSQRVGSETEVEFPNGENGGAKQQFGDAHENAGDRQVANPPSVWRR